MTSEDVQVLSDIPLDFRHPGDNVALILLVHTPRTDMVARLLALNGK